MLSAHICKQIGPRSGPTKRRAGSGSNMFDTQMVFLKDFFEKVDFEKNQQTTKKHKKFPRGQRVKGFIHVCSNDTSQHAVKRGEIKKNSLK